MDETDTAPRPVLHPQRHWRRNIVRCFLIAGSAFFLFQLVLLYWPKDFRPPNVPAWIAFDTQEVGKSYDFSIEIRDAGIYEVSVRFYVARPNPFSHLLDSPSPTHAAQLHRLMGTYRAPDKKTWTELGVPATFRVQLLDSDSSRDRPDVLVFRPETSPGYMSRSARLMRIHLQPGRHTFRVSYVEASTELSPLIGDFTFSPAYNGK